MVAYGVVHDAFTRAFRPRQKMPVWQWAERNVWLGQRATASPGRYDSSWIPYCREWQEQFGNPRIREIAICAGGQVSKTESLLNCVRYAIAEDPGAALWVMPSENLARSFSESRLQPSIRDCELTAAEMPQDSDKFKLLEMHFRQMSLNLVGANSPGNLASRPVRYLFLDEIDKYPEQSKKEAGAIELAEIRTTTFWNRKIIKTSTPTVESAQIWEAYLKGDQRRFYVPCPHCGHRQHLIWKQVKWPSNERTKPDGRWDRDQVRSATYYECEKCEQPILHQDKAQMIRAGQWQPTATCPEDRVSYHINSLYSPWLSWGDMAREWIDAQDDLSALQNFVNSRLAEPWEVKGEATSMAHLEAMKADYMLGTIPEVPRYVMITADVQRAEVYWCIRAYGQGQKSWLIDYGRFPAIGDLMQLFEREYEVLGQEAKAKPKNGLIDSGDRTQEVYEFCHGSNYRFFPVKGWERLSGAPVREVQVPFYPGGKDRRKGGKIHQIKLIHFADHLLKIDLYLRSINDKKGPPMYFPVDVEEEYLAQLTREKLVTKINQRGKPENVFVQTHKDNHWGDCEKMQKILSYLLAQKLRTAPKG